MRLSEQERLIIANQLLILEKLYPDEADYYATRRKAIEEGYTLHYSDLTTGFFEEMSEDECREVIDILQMYRVLTYSARELDDEEILQHRRLKFSGFDGNDETSQMLYTEYFIMDLRRFDELTYGLEHPDFNTHMPMLDSYRRMLRVFAEIDQHRDLTREQILSILEA